eukprot:scaffold12240_cov106-Isochrysis_galbana.AAC.3
MRYGAVCVCGVWCVGGAMWLDGTPRVSPQHASHPAPNQQNNAHRTHATAPNQEEKRERQVAGRSLAREITPSARPAEAAGTKARAPLSTRRIPPSAQLDAGAAGTEARAPLPTWEATGGCSRGTPPPARLDAGAAGTRARAPLPPLGREVSAWRITPLAPTDAGAVSCHSRGPDWTGSEVGWAGPAENVAPRTKRRPDDGMPERGPPSSHKPESPNRSNATHAASAQPPAAAASDRPSATADNPERSGSGKTKQNKPKA